MSVPTGCSSNRGMLLPMPLARKLGIALGWLQSFSIAGLTPRLNLRPREKVGISRDRSGLWDCAVTG
jgi:hypothetical protein